VLWTFCPGWPWTVILPISRIARFTGFSKCTWPKLASIKDYVW
jgi:hypothetical protein